MTFGRTIADTAAIQLANLASSRNLPADVSTQVNRLTIDVVGLCVASSRRDYVGAVLKTASSGIASAIGHGRPVDPVSAALVNGTAAHGEDFDDTFEGGPVHTGAVVVPTVVALSEARNLSFDDVELGVAAGVELFCRLCQVAPMGVHRAGFHPTSVFGAVAAAAAGAVALRLNQEQCAFAMAIAGSMSSGLIEYLSDGSSTKRLHAGWAAQSGLRAALLAEAGFTGPKSVFEGQHGLFAGFAPDVPADFSIIKDWKVGHWELLGLAFKPYACGTMLQPFVDCAAKVRKDGISPDSIEKVICRVGEGTVHRLWEPLEIKRSPRNGYHAKFSGPVCVAIGLLTGKAGLAEFDDPELLAKSVQLSKRIGYAIDPHNAYPKAFTAQMDVLTNRGTHIYSQVDFRGGRRLPLSDDEIVKKFSGNCLFGGVSKSACAGFLKRLDHRQLDFSLLVAR